MLKSQTETEKLLCHDEMLKVSFTKVSPCVIMQLKNRSFSRVLISLEFVTSAVLQTLSQSLQRVINKSSETLRLSTEANYVAVFGVWENAGVCQLHSSSSSSSGTRLPLVTGGHANIFQTELISRGPAALPYTAALQSSDPDTPRPRASAVQGCARFPTMQQSGDGGRKKWNKCACLVSHFSLWKTFSRKVFSWSLKL